MRFFNPNKEGKGLKLAASIQNLRARLSSASTNSLQTHLLSPDPSPTSESILRGFGESDEEGDFMETGAVLESMSEENICKTIERELDLPKIKQGVGEESSAQVPTREGTTKEAIRQEVKEEGENHHEETEAKDVANDLEDMVDQKDSNLNGNRQERTDYSVLKVQTSTGLRRYTDASQISEEAPTLVATSSSLVLGSGATLLSEPPELKFLSEIEEESESEKSSVEEDTSFTEIKKPIPCVYCEFKEEHRHRHKSLPSPIPSPEQEARMNVADYNLLWYESMQIFKRIGAKPYGSPDCAPLEYYNALEDNLVSLQTLYELLEFDQDRKTKHLNFTKRVHRFFNHPWEVLYTQARNDRMRELSRSKAWDPLPVLVKIEKRDEIVAVMGDLPLPGQKPMLIETKKCAKPEPNTEPIVPRDA